ncbi:unnamed protein product, partial [Durusdinium trenchii]
LTNTVDGFNLFVRYVHASHERKIRELRKKWDKSALEEAMSMSQLLASFIVELQQQHAVSTALIEEKAINPFLSGDANLELELQAAVSECKADAQPADISVFKEILAVILSKRDSKLAATGQGPRITAGELELQAFNVMMASADHDVAAFSAWRLKCSDRESAQYFQQLQHSARRQKQAREIAASVTEAGPTWLMQLEVFQKQDSANFATVSAANLCGGIVNGLGRSIGVCLSPIHFYKRGSLRKAEQTCLTMLTNAALNSDLRFALAYACKTDEREKRPMLQPGIILLPGGPDESASHKVVWQTWRASGMLSKGAITEVTMNPSNSMHVIEDMRDDALPDSSDTATHVSQAEKSIQIGEDAARKLLQAALPQGLSRAAILICDLSAHTLDLAKAVYREKVAKSITTPLYYVGFAENDAEKEWQTHHLHGWLSEGFLNGSIPLPPGAPVLMSKDLPAESVSALPPKPDLSTLNWSQKKDSSGLPSLVTPPKLLTAWHDHAVYGGQFQEWLARTRAAIPLDLAECASAKAAATNKRAAGQADASVQPPQKNPRGSPDEEEDAAAATTMAAATIPATDVPKPLAWQATLPGNQTKGKVGKLVIAVGKRVFVVNDSTADLLLPAGSTLAGYYKGKFVSFKGKNADDEQRSGDVHFKLQDASSIVLYEGKLIPAGTVVAQKKAVTPLTAKVCYHEIVEQPTAADSKFFTLTVTNPIAFRPENAPTSEDKKDKDGCHSLPQSSMAGCLEAHEWETKHTSVAWVMKWQARGLQPVRPVVVMTQKLSVKAGEAVELVK